MKRVCLTLIIVVPCIAACSLQTEDTRCTDLKDKVASCGMGTVSDSAICSDSLLAQYDRLMDAECASLSRGKADGPDDPVAGCNEPCFKPDRTSSLFCVANEALDKRDLVTCCKTEPEFYKAQTAQCDALNASPQADGGLVPDAGPVCGDNLREGAEQCDDGNTINLDGCDAECRFEQDHRINALQVQFGTDDFCATNVFGTAFPKQMVRDMFQSIIDESLKDGTGTMLYKMLELDDLTGVNDPAVVMGWMSGTPVSAPGYDGTSDLDWWYEVDPGAIDASRDPLALISGSITSGVLTAGPGNLTIGLNLGGTMANLGLSNAMVQVALGPSSTPLVSGGDTPGHLASEQLDPGLVSFASADSGQICSNISAHSLAQVPVPDSLVTYCSEKYTTSNTILDMIVNGCTVLFLGQVIAPTQPDAEDPTVPPAGQGPAYTLVVSNKAVTGCKDASGQSVDLTSCLKDAAYSSYMRFASGRVIIK